MGWSEVKVLRGADEGVRGREKEELMMTDEDLREQRRARKRDEGARFKSG